MESNHLFGFWRPVVSVNTGSFGGGKWTATIANPLGVLLGPYTLTLHGWWVLKESNFRGRFKGPLVCH